MLLCGDSCSPQIKKLPQCLIFSTQLVIQLKKCGCSKTSKCSLEVWTRVTRANHLQAHWNHFVSMSQLPILYCVCPQSTLSQSSARREQIF